jgi:molybdenum cofactor cytidylyltransferase
MTAEPEPLTLSFGAIILAAGGSTRMGRPKQLLPIEGTPLLLRAVQAVLSSHAQPIVVVLGHAAEKITPLLALLPIEVVENPRWNDGLGTSITAGLEALDRLSREIDGVLLALGDQPQLSPSGINALASVFTRRDSIAAAKYAGIIGAPAIFGRSYFADLRALAPGEGAQRVIRANAGRVTSVELPEFAVDLDTPTDYARYLESLEKS